MCRSLFAISIVLGSASFSSADGPTEFKGHSDLIHSVAVSPDGKSLATAGFDSQVKIWDLASGKKLATLSGHPGPVYCVAYRPDGKVLASSSHDKTIRLWSLAENKTTQEIKTHTDIVDQIAFSPDGKYLASCSADKSVRLSNATDGKEVKNLGTHGGAVYTVAFSPDSKYLASGGADNVIKVWDVAGMKELKTIKGPEMAIFGLAFSPDNKSVISVGLDRFIRIFDVASGKQTSRIGSSSQEATVPTSALALRFVKVKLVRPTEYDLFGIAWSRDGKTLATVGYDGTIGVWDVNSGKATFTHRIRAPAYCITFLADGKSVVTGHALAAGQPQAAAVVTALTSSKSP